MHLLLSAILIGLWVAAAISMAVMGWLGYRRTNTLARKAHEMFMQFATDDPFDVPRRYGPFAIVAAGHSPRASNVTYGRLAGVGLRAFDFRYEIGHGTQRATRACGVVVLESLTRLAPLLMWREDDADTFPMASRLEDGRAEGWAFRGESGQAARLGACCRRLAAVPASVQCRDGTMMLCFGGRHRDYVHRLDDALTVVREMGLLPLAGAPHASQETSENKSSDYPSIPGVENSK